MSDRDWKEYNEALVRRGEVLLDLSFLSSWSEELKAMNEGKEGARFRYPESFMRLLAVIHAYLLPYRQLEGFVRALTKHVDGLKAPDYTTIWWRLKRMKLELDPEVKLDEDVTIAVDSSGIKVSNRGEWIRRKWKVRRGYLKVHIAVDVRTKQILSIEVTKEDVHDGKMLRPLVDKASKNAKVSRVLADGAYDSRRNFRYLAERGIEPVIKVRRNSSTKARGCYARRLAVIEQLDEGWKKKHGYGMRWMAESAFSCIKRMFGEHIRSVRGGNIVKELILKAYIYNLFMGMNP